MRPVKTDSSNVRLIHPEEEGKPDDQRQGDLFAERMFLVDPETQDQRPGFESVWIPTDGERKALANGAPITLRLWGSGHPPVNMLVGDPPEDEVLEELVTVAETREAAGKFFERLSTRMEEVESGGEPIATEEIGAMFNLALGEVITHRPGRSGENGSGPGD